MARGTGTETEQEIAGIEDGEVKERDGEEVMTVLGESGSEEPVPRTHGEAKDVQVDMPMTTDASRSRGPAVKAPDSGNEPVSPTPSDGLRRASSKVADLRAAFERQKNGTASLPVPPVQRSPVARSPDAAKRPFDRSPARCREQDDELGRTQQQQEAEISKLRDRLEKETELRQALEDKCTALEEETEELRARLWEKDGHWRREVERKSKETSGELTNLRSQLVDLKKSIAAATRQQSQTADSTFAQEMQHLYHQAQNWVVNNYRRVKLDRPPEQIGPRLDAIAEPTRLEQLKPVFQGFGSSGKLAALQAVTACYLMEIFEEPLLFGMPADADARRNIAGAAETLAVILDPPAFNKWRAATLDAIKQSTQITESVDSAARSVSNIICMTLNTLTGAEDSPSKVSSLNAIIKRTISLAHSFRAQRARYHFTLPPPNSAFLGDRMEDNSLECERPAESTIQCATFPVVTKCGDENGDNVELSNIIVKAKVLCKS